MDNTEIRSTEKVEFINGISLRDFYASRAMLAVMDETQKMRIASFWDWIKFLLQEYVHFTFLTVKYKKVENVYEDAAKRCFEYSDAMINESINVALLNKNPINNSDEITNLKFEILNYVVSESFTIDGLADKLNELTKLCTSNN